MLEPSFSAVSLNFSSVQQVQPEELIGGIYFRPVAAVVDEDKRRSHWVSGGSVDNDDDDTSSSSSSIQWPNPIYLKPLGLGLGLNSWVMNYAGFRFG